MAPEVETEKPENRFQRRQLQAVVATGEIMRLVGAFRDQRRDRERQHHQRHALRVQDQHAGHEAEDGCDQGREDQPGDRIGIEVNREDRRGVGAGSEEGRVAERDDAGMPQGQLERQREQDHDEHVGAEAQEVREQKESRRDDGPWQQMESHRPARCGWRRARRGVD